MEIERVKELQKPLIEALLRLQRPVETLTIISLANEFYTLEQRKSLYAEYEALLTADDEAYSQLSKSSPEDDLNWDDRVRKYGEEVAQQHLAPFRLAMDKRKEALANIANFEKTHGLIVHLHKQRSSFAKRDN